MRAAGAGTTEARQLRPDSPEVAGIESPGIVPAVHGGNGLWARWKRWDRRATAVTRRLIGAVLMPLLAVAALGFGSIDIGPSVRAARGDGALGTFEVTSRECGKSCTLYGDFRSDDGSVVRLGVLYADSASQARVGDTLPALDTGARGSVYQPTGSREWLLIIAMMALGAVIAVWWLWRYPLRALSRMRRKRSAQPA